MTTRQQDREQQQTRRLIAMLKGAGLKQWEWGIPDPPDMRLTFNSGVCIGMEIRQASFADDITKEQKFKSYRDWRNSGQLGDFMWTELTAKEILDSLLHSIEAKEKDLPQWSGKYSGRWLALNLDIDIPAACFQSWNTNWNPSKNDAFWNRMLVKLQSEINTEFDAVILCDDHWACSIKKQILGIPPIKQNIEELAEPDTPDWSRTRVTHLERKNPNMISENLAIGVKTETLIKLTKP